MAKVKASLAEYTIRFILSGIVIPLDIVDSQHRVSENRSLTKVALSLQQSGSAGSTSVVIHRDGPSGATTSTVTLAGNGAANSGVTVLGSPISCQAGDLIWAEIDGIADGWVEDLGVECFFE